MKSTKRIAILIVMVCVMLSSASVTNAATVTFSDTYGPTSVGSAAGWAGVNLSKFNSSLGTLTKVTLTLVSNTSAGIIDWDNEAGVASDVDLGIGATVTIDALGLLSATAIPLQMGSSTVDADNDGAPDYTGTDAFSVTGGSGTDTDTDDSTLLAVLNAFTGTGFFDVWLSSSISTYLSTSGGWGPLNALAGITDGTICVTYEYTPVPEPATMALLGLSGLAFLRKRKS